MNSEVLYNIDDVISMDRVLDSYYNEDKSIVYLLLKR